jgi:hypothetical protein
MNRMINRLRYDTDTATRLASDEDRSSDVNGMKRGRRQTLYRTPNGRYFMLRETQWQGEHDTMTAISESEAKDFGELHMDADEYADAFGPAEAA